MSKDFMIIDGIEFYARPYIEERIRDAFRIVFCVDVKKQTGTKSRRKRAGAPAPSPQVVLDVRVPSYKELSKAIRTANPAKPPRNAKMGKVAMKAALLSAAKLAPLTIDSARSTLSCRARPAVSLLEELRADGLLSEEINPAGKQWWRITESGIAMVEAVGANEGA